MSGRTTSVDAKLYDETGGGNVLFSGEPDYSSATITSGGDIGIGSFALQDTRDNKYYLTRRLADGNCWMVENLDLELATSGVLTSNDTDVSTEWDPYGSTNKMITETYAAKLAGENPPLSSDFTGLSTWLLGEVQSEQYGSSTFSGTWNSRRQNDDQTVADITGGTSYNNVYAAMPRSRSSDYKYSTSIRARSNDESWNVNHASSYYGHHYNWYAAVAESAGFASTNASESICPRGWQLPRINHTTKSWESLVVSTYGIPLNQSATTADTLRPVPLSFAFAGLASGGGIGQYGYADTVEFDYITRQSSDAAGQFRYLRLGANSNSGLQTGWTESKSGGFSIRCVSHGDELTDTATVIASQDPDPVKTCAAGKICYDKNGGTGSMTDQSASSNASVTLTASSFTKLGYAFAGWSTTENGFGGSLYGPNETITTGDLSSKGLQLYAKWLPSVGTMQNWTGCSTLAEHQTVALTDNRDGNVYTVAKLKDGNCWMTSNLALNLADFAGTHNLNTTNTDLNSSEALADCVNGDACYNATSNGKYWDAQTGADADSTPTYSMAAVPTRGGIYNWFAATAGSGKKYSNAGINSTICPLGWTLPTGAETGPTSMRNLLEVNYGLTDSSEGSAAIRSMPFGYLYYHDDTTTGYYWTRTPNSTSDQARIFEFSTSILKTVRNRGKTTQDFIRCLLRQ